MVNTETARTIVGIIGNVISFGLFIAPVPTFYKIIKRGAAEDFSPVPYLATIINCALWVFYGLPFVHPHSLLVVTINGVGLFLEICYTVTYLIYATNQQRLRVFKFLAIEVVFYVIVVGVTLGAFHTFDSRSMFVGVLCVIFGACMYASPLSVVRLVIKTKSVEYMPFFLSLASFLNGLIWLTYALLRFDPYILTGNGLGTLFGIIQLVVYAIYYKTTPKEGKKQSEVQMTNDVQTRV